MQKARRLEFAAHLRRRKKGVALLKHRYFSRTASPYWRAAHFFAMLVLALNATEVAYAQGCADQAKVEQLTTELEGKNREFGSYAKEYRETAMAYLAALDRVGRCQEEKAFYETCNTEINNANLLEARRDSVYSMLNTQKILIQVAVQQLRAAQANQCSK